MEKGLIIADAVRGLGYSVDMPFAGGKMGALFKKAERRGAKFAIIFGEEELARQSVQVKDLVQQAQEEVPLTKLPDYLEAHFEELE